MSANANGTPTTNFSIPKFNTPSDAPNGKGVNEMMDALDSLLQATFQQAKLTTTGDMLYSSSGATTNRLGVGSSGQKLTVASGLPSWRSPVIMRRSVGGAYTSTSGVGTMLGIAGSFTPGASGFALLGAWGQIYNQNGAAGQSVQIFYGTGAAPTLGAAQIGTGAAFTQSSPVAANTPIPWAVIDAISGLVPGTTYWFDLSLNTTAGTAAVSNPGIVAVEL